MFESSTTSKLACDDDKILSTKSVKDPEAEPPPTKPVPKPTLSPTLNEEIAKEPPLETMMLEEISDSSAPCVIVKLISEREP